MKILAALWFYLSTPRANGQLCCPDCGGHRRSLVAGGLFGCRRCGEILAEDELVMRCTPATRRNYRLRRYGTTADRS